MKPGDIYGTALFFISLAQTAETGLRIAVLILAGISYIVAIKQKSNNKNK